MTARSLSDVLPIAQKAIDNGGSFTSLRAISWNCATRCENPRRATLEGRPDRKPLALWWRPENWAPYQNATEFKRWSEPKGGDSPFWVDMDVPCRRCGPCLRARAHQWRERMESEINCASRTWFGTLTLAPENHYLAQCYAERSVGQEWASLSEDDQFRERVRAVNPWLTNYVKRLRESAGSGLRICFVAEAHKSGLPHWHGLIHEPHGVHARHATLADQWPHGFTKWKLVKDGPQAARYVAKYLAKSSLARVRASLGYGNPKSALAPSREGRGLIATVNGAKSSVPALQNGMLEARKETD